MTLPGFGVEMAVKNMEYSALDDRKVRLNDKAFTQQMKIAPEEIFQYKQYCNLYRCLIVYP